MSPEINTKDLIFRKCVHLFADDGYESVSMKAIAKACGIQSASIYNHYSSKEEILEIIYRYFVDHQNDCRPTREAYLPVLKTGTAVEIVGIFQYPMSDESDPEPLMFDIIRIFWGRIYTDPQARDLYRRHVVEEAHRYIGEVLNEGIALGRLDFSSTDIPIFASLLLAARNYVASSIPLYPDVEKWRNTGAAMIDMLAGLLRLGPPVE